MGAESYFASSFGLIPDREPSGLSIISAHSLSTRDAGFGIRAPARLGASIAEIDFDEKIRCQAGR